MKRCPTCQRTFSDESLSFCTEDGTPLSPVQDEEITRVTTDRKDEEWNAPPYQPPLNSAHVPPRQSKGVPWVVVIIIALVLGVVVGVVALVLLVPRLASRQREASRSAANTNVAPKPSPSISEAPSNANSNQTHEVSQPPSDKDQVFGALTAIENDWTIANINADKGKLDVILADDFVGSGPDGRVLGKVEYIDTIQRDTSIEKWEFEDLQLTLRGERATLTGKVRYMGGNAQQLLDFVDRFVWRDGRWQATSSEVKLVK